MRTRYTLINMVVNVGGQLMNQVLLFISRMVFIHYLSAAYLGVNGLFTDVLGILNLAELGVGTAMIYSLYEPAAKNDEHRLAQLMNLYRLLYRIVAVVVLLVGLALMPFLGFFIKDSSGIEHLRLIYLMYVANSVCSYLLSYKNSIYLAYQKAYVRNLWAQLCDAVKTLFESAINLAASLLLVQKFGVAGILGGTVISTVTTCLWMEPYILMRYGIREDWQGKLKDYFVRYAERVAVVAALAAVSYGWVSFCPAKNIGWFLLDGVLYTLLFGAVMVVLHRNAPEFNQLKGRVTAVLKRRES